VVERILAITTMVLSLGATLLPVGSPAEATVIDFEGLPDSTALTTQFSGLTFSGATVLTSGAAGGSLNELDFPPRSGDNAVVSDSGVTTIVFDTLQGSVAVFLNYAAPVTLTAFDGTLNPVATDVSDFDSNLGTAGAPGSATNEVFDVAWPAGISRVTLEIGGPGDFTLDDLTFVEPTGTPGVPGPASAVLLVIGALAATAYRASSRRCA
jgi:hypothetical protein